MSRPVSLMGAKSNTPGRGGPTSTFDFLCLAGKHPIPAGRAAQRKACEMICRRQVVTVDQQLSLSRSALLSLHRSFSRLTIVNSFMLTCLVRPVPVMTDIPYSIFPSHYSVPLTLVGAVHRFTRYTTTFIFTVHPHIQLCRRKTTRTRQPNTYIPRHSAALLTPSCVISSHHSHRPVWHR